MKKILLFVGLSLLWNVSGWAATHEFGSMEEAQANVGSGPHAPLPAQDFSQLPTDSKAMADYLLERLEHADLEVISGSERLDKSSSFDRFDGDSLSPEEKKSYLEKVYDEAIERVSGDKPYVGDEVRAVEYYAPSEDGNTDNSSVQDMPQINLLLPNGMPLRAPAYEHIPNFSSQIEILPNQMLKVKESIIVIANGQKVKKGLVRFIQKKGLSNQHKVRVILDSVSVNGTAVRYEIKEQGNYYSIQPRHMFDLPNGVYVFEFSYFIDHALADNGDFYEFYWDVTGSQFNLLTTHAIASVKLPGREPAVKKYALTGRVGALTDKNAVFVQGNDNILGFASLYPLQKGEGLHIFMTLPKVDFAPVTFTQKLVWWLEDIGDILLCGVYLLVVLVSCCLSWLYIRYRLKFRNVALPSALMVRTLWRGGVDAKSIGCVLLDLFKRNIIEIEAHEDDVILVRKTAHARHLTKFERKILSVLFSKKDSIFRLQKAKRIQTLWRLVRQESAKKIRRLGAKLSGVYVLFNVLMLAALQISLVQWNNTSFLSGILLLADGLLLIAIGAFVLLRGSFIKQLIAGFIVPVSLVAAGLIMAIYLHWSAIAMMLLGVCIALIFSQKASGQDALLKNAVQSAYQMRSFLSEQKEVIGGGRNFAAQQANIFALDLENEYPNNDKIKSHYRLSEVEKLLDKF